jgi:hypothetical protein
MRDMKPLTIYLGLMTATAVLGCAVQFPNQPPLRRGTMVTMLMSPGDKTQVDDALGMALNFDGELTDSLGHRIKKGDLSSLLASMHSGKEGPLVLDIFVSSEESMSLPALTATLKQIREAVPPGREVTVRVLLNSLAGISRR